MNDISTGIALCHEILSERIVDTFRLAEENGMVFIPPTCQVGFVYTGFSETVGAWKIGFATDTKKREKSLNTALGQVGLPRDYVMLDRIALPIALARQYERKALSDLSGFQKHGEWFECGNETMDWMLENYDQSILDWLNWQNSLTLDKLLQSDYFFGLPVADQYLLDKTCELGFEWIKLDLLARMSELTQAGLLRMVPRPGLRLVPA